MQRRLPGGVAKNGRSYITPTRGPYVQRRSGMWIPDASKRHPGFAVLRSATSWYDTRDLTSTTQHTLPNRVNASATAAQLGSTSGSDTNDPVALPYSGGLSYVYLPGTASNNLSIPKDGGWAATLHVTATLIDDTTATFTTTASPILIGNTLLAAGRYKKFVVRDTDANGTMRVTIEPAVETLGQASWTCTTGQTVTVNRATSGLTTAVVTRPLLMADGTDDYIQLPAEDTPMFTATTGAYTVMLINRVHNLAGAATFSRVWSSESASANGAAIYLNAANAQYRALAGGSGGSASAGVVAFTATTEIHAVALVANAGTLHTYSSTSGLGASTSIAATGTVTHASPRVASRAYSVATPADFETYAVVHWTRALTDTELNAAAAYLLGSYR